MANLVIAERGLALPRSYKHAFQILIKDKVISPEVGERMQKMVGFRNIAVHDYASLDVAILKSILKTNLIDLESYFKAVLAMDDN